MTRNTLDRRTALVGAAALAASGALVACGGNDSASGATGTSAQTTYAGIGGAVPSSAAAPAAASGALGKTADVPVGSGKIFADAKVVVTQPASGTFKCFTAVCTHQGCLVSQVTGDNIVCGCHGSSFSIKDGSVTNGPATEPLKEEKVTVSGDDLTLGA
ncbi:Rieske (2Fe-2S) protein [Nakamurella endophytica]|uniref:Cytochrome bc1 complex Rieske iron-sulfur subunit n=1 Tax=Nakamurella endophytica TaxID=1748367 RepID=A0A917SQ40_9ACTN|nr:Rieske (2Fe-2S) protein [Nakamurella endophytica]GGL90024.1 iron-sulfur protein [Nakamurella endophytica]